MQPAHDPAEKLLTVRELYERMSGDPGEHWLLTTGDFIGACQRPPAFEWNGDLVVALDEAFASTLGVGGHVLTPDGAEAATQPDDFQELVMRLAADQYAMIMFWDPVSTVTVPISATKAGHAVRFVLPAEVVQRLTAKET